MDFFRRCWGFAVPLVLIIIAVTILFVLGASTTVLLVVSQVGTALVIGATLCYIVFKASVA